MKKISKQTMVMIVICVVLAVTAIAMTIINTRRKSESDRPDNSQVEKDTTQDYNQDESINSENNSYTSITANCVFYDKDNIIKSESLGTYTMNDKQIDMSVAMNKSEDGRAVNTTVFVLIGGTPVEFMVDGSSTMQYFDVQEDGYSDKKINISIPITEVENAYDNIVRVVYCVYDQNYPKTSDNRLFMTFCSITAEISDLKISSGKTNDEDIIQLDAASPWNNNKNVVILDNKYIDENDADSMKYNADPFNNFLTKDDKYMYYSGNAGNQYVILYFEDGRIQQPGIYYNCETDNTLLRHLVNTDENTSALMAIVVTLGTSDMSNTMMIYGIN